MSNISARLLKISLAFLWLILSSRFAFAQNKLSTCISMASQMNKSLPAKIDFLTTLQATSCIEDKGEIYFQYVHVISNPSALPRDIQAKAKASAKSQYCGNTEFRNALKLYNFDFYYVDVSNRPLHSFTLRASDC